MNKLFTFLIVFTISSIFAQNDTIFPNLTAEWNVKVFTIDGGSYWYDSHTVKLQEDSTFSDGLWWHSVLDGSDDTVGLAAIDSGLVYYQSTAPMYLGCLHEYEDTNVQVLYDFNLEVGDTAYIDDIWPVTVTSISTSSILGTPKKSFVLSNADEIVYGLGSIKGFFRPFMTSFELGIELCSYTGDYIDSLDNPYNYSYLNPAACSVSLDELGQNDFRVFPNPAIEKFRIQSKDHQDFDYQIHDLRGSLVLKGISNGKSAEIQTEGMESGTYILTIKAYRELIIIE